jgi:glycosyltransferase involved in cell wall biosynthesis
LEFFFLMKIALLTPTFSPFSGIDRVVESQAESFARQGHEVTVFALEATMQPKGYEVVTLGMPGSPFWQRLYRLFMFLDIEKIGQAVRLLKGYDRVISHFYPMNIIAAKAKEKYGVKYIAFNYGIGFPHLFSNPLERVYMHLFRFFSNETMKEADDVFSISRFLQNELLEQTGIHSKLADKVVYAKVDRKKFHPGVSGARIRKKHGLKGEPAILFVGRISPHKGVHLLIEAFRIVRQSRSNAKLLIVGKPTFDGYYRHLRAMSDRHVIFAGFVDDGELPEYYAACDVYATASLWEGFDIPVVEAQACGKPVVAFDVCSHREVVKKGRLVKEGDIAGFAKAIVASLK